MGGKNLAIAGKKMYCLKNGSKIKLASKGARLKAKDIFDLAKGKEILYKQDAPTYSVKMGVRFLERKIRQTV
jgi:hypothetical protein